MRQQKPFVFGTLVAVVMALTVALAAGCSKQGDDTLTAAPPAPSNAQPLPMQPKKDRPKLPSLQTAPPTK